MFILFIFDLFFPSRAHGSDPAEFRRSREFQLRIQPQQRLSPLQPGTEIERREQRRRLLDPSRPLMDEFHPHFYRQTPGGGIAS